MYTSPPMYLEYEKILMAHCKKKAFINIKYDLETEIDLEKYQKVFSTMNCIPVMEFLGCLQVFNVLIGLLKPSSIQSAWSNKDE